MNKNIESEARNIPIMHLCTDYCQVSKPVITLKVQGACTPPTPHPAQKLDHTALESVARSLIKTGTATRSCETQKRALHVYLPGVAVARRCCCSDAVAGNLLSNN